MLTLEGVGGGVSSLLRVLVVRNRGADALERRVAGFGVLEPAVDVLSGEVASGVAVTRGLRCPEDVEDFEGELLPAAGARDIVV